MPVGAYTIEYRLLRLIWSPFGFIMAAIGLFGAIILGLSYQELSWHKLSTALVQAARVLSPNVALWLPSTRDD